VIDADDEDAQLDGDVYATIASLSSASVLLYTLTECNQNSFKRKVDHLAKLLN